MKFARLIFFCALVAMIFGGIGAWIGSDLFSHIPKAFPGSGNKPSSTIVSLIEEESATIDVVANVTPAVVSVIARKPRGDVLHDRSLSQVNPDLIFGDSPLTDAEAKELVDVSSGTGFFVTSDGYILTNRHVIDVPDPKLFIVTNEGKELSAVLVDTDPILDIAILRVEGTGYPTVNLADSEKIRIGQTVIAIGNTLSEFRNTVTKGVISGINRHVTAGVSVNGSEVIEKAIQTDAAINPGNSGGPLINLLGEVVGINTAVSIDGQAIAFAIPINQAKRAIEDVKSNGRILRPWFGVHYVLIEPDRVKDASSISFKLGALIVKGQTVREPSVAKDSPADKAGLKEGDVILAIDGVFLSQGNAIAELISPHRPNDTIKILYLRDKQTAETMVTLGDVEQTKSKN